MTDEALRTEALEAWEQSLVAYLDAADAMFGRGAHAGPPEPHRLDLLEVLDREQHDALNEYLSTARREP